MTHNLYVQKCEKAPAGKDYRDILLNRGRPRLMDNTAIDNIRERVKFSAGKENCIIDMDIEIKKEVLIARQRRGLHALPRNWNPSHSTNKRAKSVIGVGISTFTPDDTTQSRDIANKSIRSMLSDYLLAEESSSVVPELNVNIDACTLKYAGKKFQERPKAYAPTGTKHVKIVNKKAPDARKLSGDAKKKAPPNILPQRIKSVTFSNVLGATAEIVLLKKLPKEAFVLQNPEPLFIRLPWLKTTLGPGGRPGYLVLMRKQNQRDQDYMESHSNRAFCKWYAATIIAPYIDATRKMIGKPENWAMITFDGESGQIQEFRFPRYHQIKSGKGSAAATGARQGNDRGKQFWNLHSYNNPKNKLYDGKVLSDAQEKNLNDVIKGKVKMRSGHKKALYQFLASCPYKYGSAMKPSTVATGFKVCGIHPLDFETMAETSVTWKHDLSDIEKDRIRSLLPKFRKEWQDNGGIIPETFFRRNNIPDDEDYLQRNELSIERKRACMLPFMEEGHEKICEVDSDPDGEDDRHQTEPATKDFEGASFTYLTYSHILFIM